MNRDTVQRLVDMTNEFDDYLDENFEVYIAQADGPLRATWNTDKGWSFSGIN